MTFLHLDGTLVSEDILGMGGSGLVVREGTFAVKIPRLWRGVDVPDNGRLTPEAEAFDMRQFRIDQMNQEKPILQRLGDCQGVVPCFDLDSSEVSIRMRYMENGDLRDYLRSQKPDRQTRLLWLRSMAHTLSDIHHRRVIVADLRSDNFLIDEGMSIYLADFGESCMMPLDWDMKDSNADGESAATDIGQFGAVMFEVITGQRCKFDLMQDWKSTGDLFSWPRRDSLPSVDGLWLGHIIEACWTQGTFSSADDLATALEQAC
ncbi:hypothetical protein H2204_005082 [Knufia peltigerae]|uniref:Protein kinase domain-containing protein n=1 Tax=Knufia peltigerae TaxID=1002370 RepID=A0AA39D040_9EURO|nr:hypothetical protein H2204_005082 [Knufia peltigerae]